MGSLDTRTSKMKAIRIHAAKAMSLLVVMAGLATATSANAQHESGYDRNAQLITGLAIGAIAGYALLEAHDRHRDKHKHSRKHHDRHGHHHGHGHHRGDHVGRHYRYRYGQPYDRHHRHDRHCKHGHKPRHRRHHDKHRHSRHHGVYKVREDYRDHRGGHHKRVT